MEGREWEKLRWMRHFSCWTNCHSYHLSKQLGQFWSRTACPLSHYSYMFHTCSLIHMCSFPSSTLTGPCRDPFCTKSSHTSLINSRQTIPAHHCKLSYGKKKKKKKQKNGARDWVQKVVGWGGWVSLGCCQPRCGSAEGLLPLCTCMLCGSSPAWVSYAFSRDPWSWPTWLHCTGTLQSGPPPTHSIQSIFWKMDSLRKGNPFCLSQ